MAVEAIETAPTWFGTGDLPLFGVFHRPARGTARGGVLLCPSVFGEYAPAHGCFRQLADDLARAGFMVLRFDYAGTGDSADADSLGSGGWVDSIDIAARELRAAGCGFVAAIGLRLGATLLSQWAQSHPVDALVLWDPVGSGNRMLREARSAYKLLTGRDQIDSSAQVDTLGYSIPTAMAAAIGELRIAATTPCPTLLLERAEGRPASPELAVATNVTAKSITGQEEMLDVDVFRRVTPVATLQLMAAWIDGQAPEAEAAVKPDTNLSVELSHRGHALTERMLDLGAAHSFGIETVPVDGGGGATIVLLNTATDHHVGPGRLWVDLARNWASNGRRVVRIDLPGIGESLSLGGRTGAVSYDPRFLSDIAGIAADAGRGGKTFPIGLCSGAYHALEWSLIAPTVAVGAINPVLSLVPPEAANGGHQDPRRQVSHMPSRAAQRLGGATRLAAVKDRLPTSAWRLFDALKWHSVPTDGIRRVVDRGIDTLLFLSGDDVDPYLHRGVDDIKAMSSSGRFRFVTTDVQDHALLTTEVRERAAVLLDEWVALHGLPDAAAEK